MTGHAASATKELPPLTSEIDTCPRMKVKGVSVRRSSQEKPRHIDLSTMFLRKWMDNRWEGFLTVALGQGSKRLAANLDLPHSKRHKLADASKLLSTRTTL